MSNGKLFIDSGVVHVHSCLVNRADQGNIPGEVGIFVFGLQDKTAVSGAWTAKRPVQLELDSNLRAEITITGINIRSSQSGTKCVAQFYVDRHIA